MVMTPLFADRAPVETQMREVYERHAGELYGLPWLDCCGRSAGVSASCQLSVTPLNGGIIGHSLRG